MCILNYECLHSQSESQFQCWDMDLMWWNYVHVENLNLFHLFLLKYMQTTKKVMIRN